MTTPEEHTQIFVDRWNESGARNGNASGMPQMPQRKEGAAKGPNGSREIPRSKGEEGGYLEVTDSDLKMKG